MTIDTSPTMPGRFVHGHGRSILLVLIATIAVVSVAGVSIWRATDNGAGDRAAAAPPADSIPGGLVPADNPGFVLPSVDPPTVFIVASEAQAKALRDTLEALRPPLAPRRYAVVVSGPDPETAGGPGVTPDVAQQVAVLRQSGATVVDMRPSP